MQLPLTIRRGSSPGLLLRTGEHCTETGWWTPLERGGRRFVTRGGLMPAFEGQPILWESRRKRTVPRPVPRVGCASGRPGRTEEMPATIHPPAFAGRRNPDLFRRRKGGSVIALLVIDMQNAYFEDPALAARQDHVVAACNELLAGFHSNGYKALLIGTEHERDKSTWSLNMLDDDQGFIFRSHRPIRSRAGLTACPAGEDPRQRFMGTICRLGTGSGRDPPESTKLHRPRSWAGRSP